jgi:hypothetical protein
MQEPTITPNKVEEVRKLLSHGDLKEIEQMTGLDYKRVRQVFYAFQKKDRNIVVKAALQIIRKKIKALKQTA